MARYRDHPQWACQGKCRTLKKKQLEALVEKDACDSRSKRHDKHDTRDTSADRKQEAELQRKTAAKSAGRDPEASADPLSPSEREQSEAHGSGIEDPVASSFCCSAHTARGGEKRTRRSKAVAGEDPVGGKASLQAVQDKTGAVG